MKNLNYLSLDGRSLRVFIAVLEEQSVSLAAHKLGLTQSAVSHILDRLRELLNDPLFIRSGRGITSTQYANSIAEDVRSVLDRMQILANSHQFDPSIAELEITIAANDFQRDLILTRFYKAVRQQTKDFRMRVIASDLPTANLLRLNRADMVLGLSTPEATDILQKRLLSDQRQCFYDPDTRLPPESLEDFQQAEYISTTFTEHYDPPFTNNDYEPNVMLRVANFAGLAKFLKGSDMLATVPSLLQHGVLQNFASVNIPTEIPPINLYMLWHQRHQSDPAHRWLRGQISQAAHEVNELYQL